MHRGKIAFALLAMLVALSQLARAEDETVWVQAAKTQVRAEPKMNGAEVLTVERGTELKVLKKDSVWYQVKVNGKEGWISKLFVSQHKPIGNATLLADVKEDPAKASRRRSSSYDVSASTRGLTANSRVREGREIYRADFQALEKLEAIKLTPEQLKKFQKDGRIGSEGN